MIHATQSGILSAMSVMVLVKSSARSAIRRARLHALLAGEMANLGARSAIAQESNNVIRAVAEGR